MTYLQLSPDATRLRKTAKAYAAGEIGISEYRRLRREVIVEFDLGEEDRRGLNWGGMGNLSDDDTQPRLHNACLQPVVEPDVAKPKSRVWLWFSLSLLLVVGLVSAASAQQTIPELNTRSPNPAASLRLQVGELIVRNFQPVAGTSEDEVRAFLAQELVDIKARHAPGAHGFSEDELVEVAKYLASIGVHDNKRNISVTESRELLAIVQDQKQQRGIPLFEIEQAATRLQNHLRDNGALVAVAFVPEQTVTAQVVELIVLPGNLAAVKVSGLKAASTFVADAFAGQINKPANKADIEASFYQLSDRAGLRMQGEFVPGDAVGDTNLLLSVLDERALSAVLGVDNHGSDILGDQRAFVHASWINPTNRGDRLNFGFVQGLNPSESNAGYMSYEMPLTAIEDQLTVSVQRNGFDWNNNGLAVDGDAVAVDGDAWIFDVNFERVVERSRQRSLKLNAHSGYHKLQLDPGFDQKLLTVGIGAGYTRVFDEHRFYFDAEVGVDAGHVSHPVIGQDENIWRVSADFLGWKPFKFPLLSREIKVALRGQVQITNQQLPETLRLPLGGHSQVRGFDFDISAADRGAVVTLEVHTPIALGEVLIFADGAYGDRLNDQNPGWTQITSFGVGWQAQFFNRLESEFSISLPLSSKQTGGLVEDGARVYWSLHYQY